MSKEAIKRLYGNKFRTRACGICLSGSDILLVRHKALTSIGYFFSPPGGGMHYGEEATHCLKREFLEESGLEIEVVRFLFVHEFLSPPLHAIELFFEVRPTGGSLKVGFDPEMEQHEQIIESVDYLSPAEVDREKGEQMHHMINLVTQPKELLNWQGYFKFDGKTLK